MCFRDYVFVLLLFGFAMFAILSVDLRQLERDNAIRQEIADLRQTAKAQHDSLMFNVKRPVWWR